MKRNDGIKTKSWYIDFPKILLNVITCWLILPLFSVWSKMLLFFLLKGITLGFIVNYQLLSRKHCEKNL